MAKSVLDGKMGLILNVESDGTDTQSARVFQVSIMFGKFGHDSWPEKTWRVEGVPIPNRFLSLSEEGEVASFPEEDILPAQDVFSRVEQALKMADVLVVWYQGFHAHILATELRRHGFELPQIHVCDAQFLFKMAYKYESGLKKNLESAVDLYGLNMSEFGTPGSPSRKVFAIRWVLDRLIEDDQTDDFLCVKSLSSMTKKLAQSNALEHINFKQYLEKKGKNTSDMDFKPWPPAPENADIFSVDEPPFGDFPELAALFDEVTEPVEPPMIVPVEVSEEPLHVYMMGGLTRDFTEQAPIEFQASNGESMWVASGVADGSYRVTIEAPTESMKAAQNDVSSWPVIIKGHPDAEFEVTDVRPGSEDQNSFVEMVLAAR